MEWLKRDVKLNCPDFFSEPSVLEKISSKMSCESNRE